MHPIVIGHRGASGHRPEHTRSAFTLAFALGADAVEPDLVATRDGVLVIRHENEISSTTDVATRAEFAARRTEKHVDGRMVTGWFTEDFTWAELSTLRARERLPTLRQSNTTFDDQQPILRLRDLFDLVDAAAEHSDRALGIVAEIKHGHYFASLDLPLPELFAAEVSAAGWNTDRLTVESFEPSVLAQVRAQGIRGKRIFLLEDQGHPADQLAEYGAGALSYADHLTADGLAALAAGRSGTRLAGGSRSSMGSSTATGDIGVDGISVPKSLILDADDAGDVIGASALVDHAHAAGLEIYCWTLRPENKFLAKTFRSGTRKADFGHWQSEFRLILDSGVDGVFADHPDLAVHVRDARR
ncbi:glycerophosphodiester phosphodiesterase family protein [Cryobacterium sp. PH31-O1]|uniref:glycerophosphodiester phosphodiesterase family protein n=1 Tax=Cryobacterium sp. PH31-O1 TaxID=3046306 RepID=UPI0024BA8F54|nr:glycerophosphodiester phosphodiesterase family protein [Cryobacterium sp. PH31-O1]MDJ0337688.1 glycerophosphodiester phosphodiesterase family protein [Cryobacterium sp. PH31-O1]